MDANISDGAAVLALFKIPAGPRAQQQRVLAAKGDGVNFTDTTSLDQIAHANKR